MSFPEDSKPAAARTAFAGPQIGSPCGVVVSPRLRRVQTTATRKRPLRGPVEESGLVSGEGPW